MYAVLRLILILQGLDVVVTDVAAGLVLIQLEQKRTPVQYRLEPLTYASAVAPTSNAPIRGEDGSYTNVIDVEPPEEAPRVNPLAPGLSYPSPSDWMNIPLAAHYMKFASASYGWPLFMYSNLCCGLCKLCGTCRLVHVSRFAFVLENLPKFPTFMSSCV